MMIISAHHDQHDDGDDHDQHVGVDDHDQLVGVDDHDQDDDGDAEVVMR